MAVAMVVLGSLGTACSDVVVDSIVVERSRGEPQACSRSQLSFCCCECALTNKAELHVSLVHAGCVCSEATNVQSEKLGAAWSDFFMSPC